MSYRIQLALLLICVTFAEPTSAKNDLQSYRTGDTAGLSPETFLISLRNASEQAASKGLISPSLTIYRPQHGSANGAAVVIAPGGGYIKLSRTLEGAEPAAWFTSRGVTAFVLNYRVGDEARLPLVLEDGARAMQFVRFHAGELGIDKNRVGIMGFSAGGHLAASVGVGSYPTRQAIDEIDLEAARPDFLILAYPWLEATELRDDGTSHYCDFAHSMKIECNPSDYTSYLPIKYVTSAAPPTFIFHTVDDELVPISGSTDFFATLTSFGVKAEFHAFGTGRHGVGLGGTDPEVSTWPTLLDSWLRRSGVLTDN